MNNGLKHKEEEKRENEEKSAVKQKNQTENLLKLYIQYK